MGRLDDIDLKVNPEPRAACLLLLDTSGSMDGARIAELQEGLHVLHNDLLQDSLAQKRVEIGIVTFGDTVRVVQDFVTAQELQVPHLAASGNTPLGGALRRGLELLRARKDDFKRNKINYYRPWVMLVTDGAPTDEWQAAAAELAAEEDRDGAVVFAIGVEEADFGVLRQISRKREPMRLKGLQFRELFLWLSKSQKSVSGSRPGEKAQVPSPTGWGEIPT